jgi:hypothetical protein
VSKLLAFSHWLLALLKLTSQSWKPEANSRQLFHKMPDSIILLIFIFFPLIEAYMTNV